MLKQLLKMYAGNTEGTVQMNVTSTEQATMDSATSATITRTPIAKSTLSSHFTGGGSSNMLDDMQVSENANLNMTSTQIM